MMVKLNVTVVTSAPTAGLLKNLPVGTHTVYLDTAACNYAADGVLGGTIDSDTAQYLVDGSVSGNVTYNTIVLTHQEF